MPHPALHWLILREEAAAIYQISPKTQRKQDILALVIHLLIWLSCIISIRKEFAFSYINLFLAGIYFKKKAGGPL